jgi:hypothetical protein
MAWIESHQELRDHPKTKKAARLLGIHVAQVLGHLHCLWWWCLDHAQDGNLTGYDTEEIADAAAWDGEGDLIDAFLTCGKSGKPGFLERTDDGRLLVHDWYEYAGKLMEKRKENVKRTQEWRARNAPVMHNESITNAPVLPLTVPYPTVPYSTILEPENHAPEPPNDGLTPEVRAVRNAYDGAGIMFSLTHQAEHQETIKRYGLPAWQLGFAAALTAGKHNVPAYVRRCTETAHINETRGGQHATGRRNGNGAGKPFGLRRDPNEQSDDEPTDAQRAEFLAATPA